MLQLLRPIIRVRKRRSYSKGLVDFLRNNQGLLYQEPRVVKVWMYGRIYYRTPKGYLIPEREFIRNREKYIAMIKRGEL